MLERFPLPVPAEEGGGEIVSDIKEAEKRDDFSDWEAKIDSLVKLKQKIRFDKWEQKRQESEDEILSTDITVLEKELDSGEPDRISSLVSKLNLLLVHLGGKKLQEFSQEFVVSHLDQFEKILSNTKNFEVVPQCLNAINSGIDFYNSSDQESRDLLNTKKASLLERVFVAVEDQIQSDQTGEIPKAYSKLFAPLIASGSPDVAKRVSELVVNFSSSKETNSHEAADFVIDELVSRSSVDEIEKYIREGVSDDSLTGKVKSILTKIIDGYGLDPEDLVKAWNLNSSDRKKLNKVKVGMSYIYRENLRVLRSLEQKHPGSAAVLGEKFGIKNFGRYPPELLVDQFEGLSDIETPYGLAIFPYADHNGSFSNLDRELRDLFMQTRGHHRIRVIETGGKMGIARRLISLDKQYGSRNKISFALIAGHANPDSIHFGEGSNTAIRAEDLLGRGFQQTSKFFDEKPTLIISGCRVGVIGGIAQKLSRTFGTEVIAPDDFSSGISSIKVTYENGRPSFKVKFSRATKGEGATVFDEGEKKKSGLLGFLSGK